MKILKQKFHTFVTHLFPMHPFSTLLKHQKILWFSDFFQEVEKGCIWNKWVNKKLKCCSKVLYGKVLFGRFLFISFYLFQKNLEIYNFLCLEEFFTSFQVSKTSLTENYLCRPNKNHYNFCKWKGCLELFQLQVLEIWLKFQKI